MPCGDGSTNGSAGTACLSCGVQVFERNNFFNGKLLTERDFIAEQEYTRRKNHLHNQLLHGWGTVCGLKVTEHPNGACQDEFVRVEPGVALDCCGQEIVVADERFVPLRDLANEAAQAGGVSLSEPRTIQLCLAYDECGTEEVPALFADCGCDDNGTEPNRIREGGQFSVRIASTARPRVRPPVTAHLDWRSTVQVEKPAAVIADNQLSRLYLVAGDEAQGRLDVYDAGNHSYEGSIEFPALFNANGDPEHPAAVLALSQFGDRLFVAAMFDVEGEEAPVPRIRAYAVDTLLQDTPAFVDLVIAQPVKQLLVSPVSGALFALDGTSNTLMVWDIPVSGDPGPAPAATLDLGAGARHIALTHNSRHLFVAGVNGDGKLVLSIRPVATLDTATDVTFEDADDTPVAMAISYDDVYLYLLSRLEGETGEVTSILRRYDISDPLAPAPAGPAVPFVTNIAPVGLAVAPGDRWAYLYLRDTVDAAATADEWLRRQNAAVVVPYRLAGLESPEPESGFGKVIDVGTVPLALYQTFRGERLYAVSGDPENPPDNQVAVITVIQEPCDDIFLDSIDHCPSCDDEEQDDCVVLATIPDYVLGARVVNAGIDNVTDRQIVPSTAAITEVVKCIIEQGVGQGVPGPRGPVGDRGRGIEDVVVDAVLPPDTDPGTTDLADYDPVTETLTLRLIRGADGAPGRQIEAARVTFPADWTENDPSNATVSVNPADNRLTLFLKLPRGGTTQESGHITGLSWIHDSPIGNIDEFLRLMLKPGIVISFDRPVQMRTVTRMTFQAWVRHVDRSTELICECFIPIRQEHIFAFEVTATENVDDGRVLILEGEAHQDREFADAIAIMLNEDEIGRLREVWHGNELLFDSAGVILRCDFVLDEGGVAIDGNHIGGRVPTGDGAQGDTFESWVRFEG